MTILSDYVAGTATLTNGSAAVTGAGTGWLSAGFREGDLLLKEGFAAVVLSVTDEDTLTLTEPWPGASGTGVTYRLRYLGDGERVTAQARMLIELLGNGNLQAFAALVGSNNMIPVFTGPGSMVLRPMSEILTGLTPKGAWSNVTTYAKGDYIRYLGNTFISKTDPNLNHTPPASAADNTDWMYAPTVAGEDGADGHSLIPRGDWSAVTTYAIADYVGYSGRTFISKTAGNLNNVPPTSDTSDTNWMNVPFVTPSLEAQGVYNAGTTYKALDFVSYLGRNFVSKLDNNIANTPPTSATDNTQWAFMPSGPTGPGLSPKGAWSNVVTYTKGDVIVYLDNAFVSFLDGNLANTPPATAVDDTNWMYLPSGGGAGAIVDIFEGLGIVIDKTDPANPVIAAVAREKLTSARTYYVRTDGSDANDGLADTALGAFLTIQKAIDVVASLDTSIYNVTVQVGAGTYSETPTFKQIVGSGTLTVVGDNTTPANCVISAGAGICALLGYDSPVTIEGFRLSGTGIGLLVTAGKLSFRNIEFNTTGSAHIYAAQFGLIQAIGDYSIIAGAARHVNSEVHGKVYIQTRTVTITGTPAFSVAFVNAKALSHVSINGNTFMGSATGPRFVVTGSAIVSTNNAGLLYLPGSVAGTLVGSGAYDSLIGGVRELLTANRTYYVRTDGNNNNDGLTNTSGGAFLTIQKAIEVIATIDLNGFTATVSVGGGNFGTTATVVSAGWVGGNVTITLDALAIIPGFSITKLGGILTINGSGKIQPATNTQCIYLATEGTVRFSGIDFGSSGTQNHIAMQHPGAFVQATGSYSISGSAASHVLAYWGSLFTAIGITVTLTGTPAFSIFINADMVSAIRVSTTTFSGAATGKRYQATMNSVINTLGGGANYFPGDVAGTVATGGQYA